MSEAFIVAGRLTLTPEEFEAWLQSPSPGPESVEDWDRMYAGWFWKTHSARLNWEAGNGTVEDRLRETVRLAQNNPFIVLLKYFDEEARNTAEKNAAGSKGEFWLYVMSMMGNDDRLAERLMAIVRTAASHKSEQTLEPVVYWPDMSGALSYGGVLSVALVGSDYSEFGDAADLAAAGYSKAKLEKQIKPLTEWYSGYFDDAFEEDSSAPRPHAWARPEFIDQRFVAQ